MKHRHLLVILVSLLLAGTASMQAQSDNIWETPERQQSTLQAAKKEALPIAKQKSEDYTSALRLSVGPSWITSKVYVGWNGDYVTSQMGYELAADYECVGRKGWGWGLNASFNRTNYDGYGRLSLFHIGPSAVYAGMLGSHWRMSGTLGLGMALCYQDDFNRGGIGADDSTEGGIGILERFSVEYMLSERIGIGLDLNGHVSLLVNGSGVSLPNDEINGFVRYSVLLGCRFHF